MEHLLWTDYVLLVIIIGSTVLSLTKGFFKELFSVLTIAIAVFIAFRFSGAFAKGLNYIFGEGAVSEAFAMTTSFVLLFIILNKISNRLIRKIGQKGFSITDRLLGVIFGFLRGLIVAVAIVALTIFAPVVKGDAWLKTPVTLRLKPFSDLFLSYVPPTIKSTVQKQIKEVDESPAMQQTKKLINAVFGTDLDIKKTDQSATEQPTEPQKNDSNKVTEPADSPSIVETLKKLNTPLIRDNKAGKPKKLSDRQILLEKQKQLEELKNQQQQETQPE